MNDLKRVSDLFDRKIDDLEKQKQERMQEMRLNKLDVIDFYNKDIRKWEAMKEQALESLEYVKYLEMEYESICK